MNQSVMRPLPGRLPVEAAALFLDLDGTLAPFAETPCKASLPPGLTGLLRSMRRALAGRLAIVSGRTIGDVDHLLQGAVPCVSGVHGLQVRGSDGVLRERNADARLPAAIEALEAFARSKTGLIVERKGQSVAVHYRRAPALADAAVALARDVSRASGLELLRGNMVVELMPPGSDKGGAVRQFMAGAPFRGAVPIYVGDDLTDEPAFAVVAEMAGFGIIVGRRAPTQARFRMSDPQAVFDWLAGSLRSRAFAAEDLAWAG